MKQILDSVTTIGERFTPFLQIEELIVGSIAVGVSRGRLRLAL
jgi:hypothetical protein